MTFVKIINVDKNNKRVFYKFLVNVASVYDICGLSHGSGRQVLVGLQYRASLVTASSWSSVCIVQHCIACRQGLVCMKLLPLMQLCASAGWICSQLDRRCMYVWLGCLCGRGIAVKCQCWHYCWLHVLVCVAVFCCVICFILRCFHWDEIAAQTDLANENTAAKYAETRHCKLHFLRCCWHHNSLIQISCLLKVCPTNYHPELCPLLVRDQNINIT